MTVEERRRIELFEQLVPVLGEEAATTMLELLPPPGQDVATKDNIIELQAATKRHIDELQAATKRDIDGLQAATKRDIDELRQYMAANLVTREDLRETLSHELSHYATKSDLHREFVTFFLAQTAALGGLLAASAAFFG